MTPWTCPCPNCTDGLRAPGTDDGLDLTEGSVLYTGAWITAAILVAASLVAVLAIRRIVR